MSDTVSDWSDRECLVAYMSAATLTVSNRTADALSEFIYLFPSVTPPPPPQSAVSFYWSLFPFDSSTPLKVLKLRHLPISSFIKTSGFIFALFYCDS